MEKTLTIDGKEVKFKTSGAFPLRYKAAFGVDMFSDLAKLDGIEEDITKIDTEPMFRQVYTAAKSADASIPEIDKWLEGFEVFPIFHIYNELSELLNQNLKTDIKN